MSVIRTARSCHSPCFICNRKGCLHQVKHESVHHANNCQTKIVKMNLLFRINLFLYLVYFINEIVVKITERLFDNDNHIYLDIIPLFIFIFIEMLLLKK